MRPGWNRPALVIGLLLLFGGVTAYLIFNAKYTGAKFAVEQGQLSSASEGMQDLLNGGSGNPDPEYVKLQAHRDAMHTGEILSLLAAVGGAGLIVTAKILGARPTAVSAYSVESLATPIQPSEDTAVTAQGVSEKRVPCPHCAELILPAANVCRYCAMQLR